MNKPVYNMTIEETLDYFKTSSEGLKNTEANKRLEKYGKNILPEKKKNTLISVFISQFNNPITIILIVAIILSFIIGQYVDAWFIVFVIVSDAIFGTIQEWRANKNAEALKNMLSPTTTVFFISKGFWRPYRT